MDWCYTFWKFSRPHTIIGTTLSVWGLYLIAISLFSQHSLLTPWGSWIACLCGNVYIVGLNQLEDIEIDKINKPHFPLASGKFTPQMGKLIVSITGILAILLAGIQGPFLLAMVGISLAIGTAYSLPPIRLKRFPFWAALCIFAVRGAIVNLGLFLHFSWAWQQDQSIPPNVWILTAFIIVFTFAIAIFKDIPDVEGDRQYNITTFTIKLGQRAVFNLARWVITICYLGMIVVSVLPKIGANSTFLIISHLLLLGIMWWRSQDVQWADNNTIVPRADVQGTIPSFYQFIWKLFFLEYLLFPIACLLN
ncbi:homogentisate phytyltransferase [Calothrix rhizosoleniae]|uniref:homogentisate phytyltransferase n=1 Tax=Calothrix rhizosoleniae TaxID=888997 RepID=UPI000B4A43CA|nr:homogentisate phytyltransferase [Calothrix rhizosoleniae]